MTNDTIRDAHKTALNALHQLRTLYRRVAKPTVTRDAVELSEIAYKSIDVLARAAYAHPSLPISGTQVCEIIQNMGVPTRPLENWVYSCWKAVVARVNMNTPLELPRIEDIPSIDRPDLHTKLFRLEYVHVDLIVPSQIKIHSREDSALDDAVRIMELAVRLSWPGFITWEEFRT